MNIKEENKLKGINKITVEIPGEEYQKYLNRAKLLLDSDLLSEFHVPLDVFIAPYFENDLTQYTIEQLKDKIWSLTDETIDEDDDFGFTSRFINVTNPNGREILATVYSKPEINYNYKDLDKVQPYPGLTETEKELAIEKRLSELQKRNARLIATEEPYSEDKAISLKIENNGIVEESNDVLFPSDLEENNIELNTLIGKNVGDSLINEDIDETTIITINQIYNIELDEIDDEFASEVSEFDTLDELKDSIVKQDEEIKRIEYNYQQQNELINKFIQSIELSNVDESLNKMLINVDLDEQMPKIDLEELYTNNPESQSVEQEYFKHIFSNIINQILTEENISIDEEVEEEFSQYSDKNSDSRLLHDDLERAKMYNPSISDEDLKDILKSLMAMEKVFNLIQENALDGENK